MPKHYLITGGAGFIGSHLAERMIKDGNKITIFDDFNDYYDPTIKWNNLAEIRDQIHLIQGDIRNESLIEKAFSETKYDQVIHLAARAGVRPSISDPKLYYTTNIDGTFNLLEISRKNMRIMFRYNLIHSNE